MMAVLDVKFHDDVSIAPALRCDYVALSKLSFAFNETADRASVDAQR